MGGGYAGAVMKLKGDFCQCQVIRPVSREDLDSPLSKGVIKME